MGIVHTRLTQEVSDSQAEWRVVRDSNAVGVRGLICGGGWQGLVLGQAMLIMTIFDFFRKILKR